MNDFILLGHDCPLETYPAVVLPVGKRTDDELIVIYHAHGRPQEDVVPNDSEFVRHGPELAAKLDTFTPEHHRLFAYTAEHVEIVPIDHEHEFFKQFLTKPSNVPVDPFLRLSLAQLTHDPLLVFREIGNCIVQLHETPAFLQSWCEKEVAEMIRSLQGQVPQNPETDLSRKRTILVIEDNEAWSNHLRQQFENAGYTVRTCGDGIRGIACAMDIHPDLIVMDLRMPIMDGYEALQRIKAIPELALIPIILISAHLDEWENRRAELDNIRVLDGLPYLDDFDEFAKQLMGIEDDTQRNIFLSKQVNMKVIEKHAEALVG